MIARTIKPFVVQKNVTIPVHAEVAPNLLMCSCIIVMQGKQCGPLHLALVAHCREWLWSKTDTSDVAVRGVMMSVDDILLLVGSFCPIM